MLRLATLRLPDLAVYGERLPSQAEEGCAACLVVRELIGSSSAAMRPAHRATQMHVLEVGYGVEVWLERVLDGGSEELPERESVGRRGELAVDAGPSSLATLALTQATASTAKDPRLVPGRVAGALAHLLAGYVIAVEVASAA